MYRYASKFVDRKRMRELALMLARTGKGILAVDEKLADLEKRFVRAGIANTNENRRKYRQLLVTADVTEFISGITVSPEVLEEPFDDRHTFADAIKSRGLLLGVSLDQMMAAEYTRPDHQFRNLAELDKDCARFRYLGCDFAKWRIRYDIDTDQKLIEDYGLVASRFAAISQVNQLVAIMEPKMSRNGDYDLNRASQVMENVLNVLYNALNDFNVFTEGTLLKPRMILPGFQCKKRYTADDVAAATVATLQLSVPKAVAGIGFLSGGLSDRDVVVLFRALSRVWPKDLWALTFIFGRALQGNAAIRWAGKEENIGKAQAEVIARAKVTIGSIAISVVTIASMTVVGKDKVLPATKVPRHF